LISFSGLTETANRQLFFVGGAPRSGTTWLQQMLDAHPDVSCQGEALFMNQLTAPIDALIAQRRAALEEKNSRIFRHTGGYALPTDEDADVLIGTAILLGLQKQNARKGARAVGEKTPENVFIFRRLKRIFPAAKFIAIARDPRDVLTSAWHFFHKAPPGEDEATAKAAFVRSALPSLNNGAREMLGFAKDHPADTAIVTYEGMQRNQPAILAHLFRLLGVDDTAGIVADCVARTSFAALTGGRPAGREDRGSFFRKGVVGDWRSTLSPDINALMLRELGWMFPAFGWTA
jgi:hypothetical protein